MSRACVIALACAWATVTPSTALAWSDPSRFSEPALDGGGDNRWFTGSPADGFSCNVCHQGAQGLEVTVRSLPSTYQPGSTYEIAVGWGAPLAKVAANLEITDELGRPVGTLRAPAGEVLTPPDECEPKGQGIGASQVFTLPDGRQVLGFADCGATQIRWQWTAPPIATGAVFLSGALVRSNDDETLDGDGVTVLARTLLAPGQEPLDERAIGSCSVSERRVPARWGLWCATGMGWVLGMRRLSRRPVRRG